MNSFNRSYHLVNSPASRLEGRWGGNMLDVLSGPHCGAGGEVCEARFPVSQIRSLVSRGRKALTVFLPLFTSKKNASGSAFKQFRMGKKILSHKFLWVEKQSLPSCTYTEARKWSWILFPWLHTGVHAERPSDSGVDKVTYTFHNKVQLRRPIPWWNCMARGAHASLP